MKKTARKIERRLEQYLEDQQGFLAKGRLHGFGRVSQGERETRVFIIAQCLMITREAMGECPEA